MGFIVVPGQVWANTPPTITEIEPEDSEVSMYEHETMRFKITYSDPDEDDVLSVQWYFDDLEVKKGGGYYIYTPGYYSAGKHIVNVSVHDGYDNTTKTWNVTVRSYEIKHVEEISWMEGWCIIIEIIIIVVSIIVLVYIIQYFSVKRPKKKKSVKREDT
jgi:hypothetical protein